MRPLLSPPLLATSPLLLTLLTPLLFTSPLPCSRGSTRRRARTSTATSHPARACARTTRPSRCSSATPTARRRGDSQTPWPARRSLGGAAGRASRMAGTVARMPCPRQLRRVALWSVRRRRSAAGRMLRLKKRGFWVSQLKRACVISNAHGLTVAPLAVQGRALRRSDHLCACTPGE